MRFGQEALYFRSSGYRSSMIQVGAWSLAFPCPRAQSVYTAVHQPIRHLRREQKVIESHAFGPWATVQICNPRMSRARYPDVASCPQRSYRIFSRRD